MEFKSIGTVFLKFLFLTAGLAFFQKVFFCLFLCPHSVPVCLGLVIAGILHVIHSFHQPLNSVRDSILFSSFIKLIHL